MLTSFKNQGVEVCKLIVNNREIDRILPVNILEQSMRYDNQLPESAYLHDVKVQPFFNRVLLSNSVTSSNRFNSKTSPIILSPRGAPPSRKQQQQQYQQQQQQQMYQQLQQQLQPIVPQVSSTSTTNINALAPPLKTKRKLTESARMKSKKEELTIKEYDEINIFSEVYSDDEGVVGFEKTDRLLLDRQQSSNTIKILQQQVSDYQEMINTRNDSENNIIINGGENSETIELLKNKEVELQNRIKELEGEVLTWKKKCKASINKLKEKLELINKLNSDKESIDKIMKENSEMKTSYNALQSDLEASRKEYDELNKEKFKMKREYEKEKRETKEETDKKIEEIQKLYENEMKMRIELYNELVNLSGNIRIYCRLRPLSSFNSKDNQIVAPITILNDAELSIDNLMGSTTTYCFDQIFSKDSTQDDVFTEVEPFITSALDGFNVCLFAYGQTGSGKTYTMQGTLQNPGIYSHTLQLLFYKIELQKQYNYQLSISLMEIYNDSIRDLTYPIANRKSLEIKTKVTGDSYVEGLVEVPIRTFSEFSPIFNQASKNRCVGAHNLNERSSRSHLVLIININKTNPLTGETKLSQISLIDLAGSERISKTKAEGDRLKEAQYINKSLSALGEVINHLSTHSKHIPFRNSKLTHFLQQSLTSDSKVAIFVTINPHIDQLSESICSLQFANRCKEVELNQAKKIVSRYAIEQKNTST